MDRFRKLKRIIILLAVLFTLDLVLLVLMIPVRTIMTWAVIATQVIVVVYFCALSFAFLKESKERAEKQDNAGQDKLGQ